MLVFSLFCSSGLIMHLRASNISDPWDGRATHDKVYCQFDRRVKHKYSVLLFFFFCVHMRVKRLCNND